MKIRYESSDGVIFNRMEECEVHERRLKRIDALREFIDRHTCLAYDDCDELAKHLISYWSEVKSIVEE